MSIRTKETRNAWSRQRVCSDCGKAETVRRDNASVRCRSCVARFNGALGLASRALDRFQHTATCATCQAIFPTKRSANLAAKQRFCSRKCRKIRTRRECKECGKAFEVPTSALSSKTNTSGNFCSRPCYETWLCRTNPNPARGYGWRACRIEARRRTPFCAYCGATKGLQVHHIIPYRLTADNGQDNLIPFCLKHHKVAEISFLEIERDAMLDLAATKVSLGSVMRERQEATRATLDHPRRAFDHVASEGRDGQSQAPQAAEA